MRPTDLKARYLLRFDDICPTMNWDLWERIEALLIQLDLNPILAIVPENLDPDLCIDPPKDDFWERVRNWQKRGWKIALHGYQHRYESSDAGLVGLNKFSEFSGLDEKIQEQKINEALKRFRAEGIETDLWVAPAHSFDHTTIKVLKKQGIDFLSDGFAFRPYIDGQNMTWVPQQLWDFKEKRFGLWTVCLHHNRWDENRFWEFRDSLGFYRESILEFNEAFELFPPRPKNLLDPVVEKLMFGAFIARKEYVRFRSWVRGKG